MTLWELAGPVADWLGRQRWFAAKNRSVTGVRVLADVPLAGTDEAQLHDLVVGVDYAEGPAERYQLPVGLRAGLPQRLEYASIGTLPEGCAYDAVHDPELMRRLLELIAGRAEALPLEGSAGVGPVRCAAAEGAELDTDLPARLVGAEQSNTSVVFGDAYILKLFRQLAPGLNPDLEITRALAAVGCPNIAVPLGWVETTLDGAPATLALLQRFFVSATEGWALATTSVRDLFAEGDLHADEVGGDFAAEAERLGAAVARVHADLARALPTRVAGPAEVAELARRMDERLDRALAEVPDLGRHEPALRRAYAAVAGRTTPLPLQRVHGDLHLGQALRTDQGWILLDFEGEPARPLADRTAPDTPVRDVAGMLRSFDYAARYLLADRAGERHLAYRAEEWAERNRAAFCAGYAAGGGADPAAEPTLLRAYELDKAVYEAVYEARNRPSWLAIPLGSIDRLLAEA